jgi:hypothetical protein
MTCMHSDIRSLQRALTRPTREVTYSRPRVCAPFQHHQHHCNQGQDRKHEQRLRKRHVVLSTDLSTQGGRSLSRGAGGFVTAHFESPGEQWATRAAAGESGIIPGIPGIMLGSQAGTCWLAQFIPRPRHGHPLSLRQNFVPLALLFPLLRTMNRRNTLQVGEEERRVSLPRPARRPLQ